MAITVEIISPQPSHPVELVIGPTFLNRQQLRSYLVCNLPEVELFVIRNLVVYAVAFNILDRTDQNCCTCSESLN
jgi:hypothetical protein